MRIEGGQSRLGPTWALTSNARGRSRMPESGLSFQLLRRCSKSLSSAVVIAASFLLLLNVCHPAIANDIDLEDLQGTWNNDTTGENITVDHQNIDDSRYGQGRVGMTEDWAANFRFTYQGNVRCWYYITPTSNGDRLNFAVRNPNQSADKCLSGIFNRVGDPLFTITNDGTVPFYVYINNYNRLSDTWSVEGPWYIAAGQSSYIRGKDRRSLRRYYSTFYYYAYGRQGEDTSLVWQGSHNFALPNGEVRGFRKMTLDCSCPLKLP